MFRIVINSLYSWVEYALLSSGVKSDQSVPSNLISRVFSGESLVCNFWCSVGVYNSIIKDFLNKVYTECAEINPSHYWKVLLMRFLYLTALLPSVSSIASSSNSILSISQVSFSIALINAYSSVCASWSKLLYVNVPPYRFLVKSSL